MEKHLHPKHSIAATTASFALVGATAFGALTAGSAAAGTETEQPCATQQAQVGKAAAKLERLQTVFAKEKKEKVPAEKALEKASTKPEKKAARAEFADARAEKAEAKKAKKAQVQRLAKAEERLERCQTAASETTDPTETATP